MKTKLLLVTLGLCLLLVAACGGQSFTSEEVKSAIENIDGISNVTIITEDNDPNGNLGKDGSYVGGVYFLCDWLDEYSYEYDDNYDPTDVIAMKTDNGGCVEIYPTASDAKKRDEYLAGFDGSMLASGSHTVHGTMVIRTSNNLKANEQKALEEAIIEALK